MYLNVVIIFIVLKIKKNMRNKIYVWFSERFVWECLKKIFGNKIFRKKILMLKFNFLLFIVEIRKYLSVYVFNLCICL